MSGLLPGVLPNLGDLLGGGNSATPGANDLTPIVVNQPQLTVDEDEDDEEEDDEADNNNNDNGNGQGLSIITIDRGTPTTDAGLTETPLSDLLSQTTLQTVVTSTGDNALPSATQGLNLASSASGNPAGGISSTAEANTDGLDGGADAGGGGGGGGGMSKGMIATIAGGAGAGLVLVIIGIVLFTRSRRGRWPFKKRSDDFVTLDDEFEKNSAYNQAKWDPSRAGGFDAGRISRFVPNRSGP